MSKDLNCTLEWGVRLGAGVARSSHSEATTIGWNGPETHQSRQSVIWLFANERISACTDLTPAPLDGRGVPIVREPLPRPADRRRVARVAVAGSLCAVTWPWARTAGTKRSHVTSLANAGALLPFRGSSVTVSASLAMTMTPGGRRSFASRRRTGRRLLERFMDHSQRIEALVSLFTAAVSGLDLSELDAVEFALRTRPITADRLALILGRRRHNPPSVDLTGVGLSGLTAIEEGDASLRKAAGTFSQAWIGSEVASKEDAARTAGVAVGCIENWLAAGDLVSLRSESAGTLIPLDQFDSGRPAGNIAEVVALFPGAEEAWAWLVAPNTLLRDERPIDCLHAGRASDVLRAAAGVLDFA